MASNQSSVWSQFEGIIKTLIFVVGIGVSTALYVYGNDAKSSERIAVLETKYDAVQQEMAQMRGQLTEIQADIKRLLVQVNQQK